jgi:protein-arginine kinase activator protein McsA
LQQEDLDEVREKISQTVKFPKTWNAEPYERMESSEFETAADVEDKFQQLEDLYQVWLYFAMMF